MAVLENPSIVSDNCNYWNMGARIHILSARTCKSPLDPQPILRESLAPSLHEEPKYGEMK